MRRELRFAVGSLRRRPLWSLLRWSVPEALPAALSGLAVARAIDDGFLAGRPLVGLAWLGTLLIAGAASAAGTRQVYRRLGDLVEPFRDDLVRRVVAGSLRRAVAGGVDDGAVARLTHQVEIARDTYAGLIVVVRGFVVTATGAAVGLVSIAPMVALLVLPPFLLGLAGFVATLGVAAARQRTYVRTDEELAVRTGEVLAGVRDVVADGAERAAAGLVTAPAEEQAAAQRALARVGVLTTLCFAVGGWLPLLALLAAGPWLLDRGVAAGALVGGLTYVLSGLQPALRGLIGGLGGSGLRFVVTVGRILTAGADPGDDSDADPGGDRDADAAPGGDRDADSGGRPGGGAAEAARPVLRNRGPVGAPPPPAALRIHDLTFAYGPAAAPVLRGLDLRVPPGGHLAIVGPSGVGKSTLANLLCGLLRPDAGTVWLGGVPTAGLTPAALAAARVLIPQEAYVFAGPFRENVTYLRPAAGPDEVVRAVRAVGAEALMERLGGWHGQVRPDSLSAGERQLVALVRAYLSAAPLAVLDEATCHLDPVAERRAEEAFAARDGSLVVIAHRVSSALRARQVLVLDGDDAVLGTHEEVLDRCAAYRDLLGHWAGGEAVRPGQIQPAS